MKALCLVAHPDDCVIFAYSFIFNHPGLDWTICYLTYTKNDPRGQELCRFWSRRDIATQFLGYVDDYRDISNKKISFDIIRACRDIQRICCKHDIILTHDAAGDYGHIHHKFVHDSVPTDHHVITFAGPGSGTNTYIVPSNVYSIDELPMHGDIVAAFHCNGHINSYAISADTKVMLDQKHN